MVFGALSSILEDSLAYDTRKEHFGFSIAGVLEEFFLEYLGLNETYAPLVIYLYAHSLVDLQIVHLFLPRTTRTSPSPFSSPLLTTSSLELPINRRNGRFDH